MSRKKKGRGLSLLSQIGRQKKLDLMLKKE